MRKKKNQNKITVNVTEKHISQGQSKVDCCPIALAIKELGISYVSVNQLKIYFYKDKYHTWDNSKEVINFIKEFDSNIPVKPFTFEMEIKEL